MDLFWSAVGCHGFFLLIGSFWFLHKWEKDRSVIFRICLFVPALMVSIMLNFLLSLRKLPYTHFWAIFKP